MQMAEIGCQLWQEVLYIGALLVPRNHAMHREGVAQIVKPGLKTAPVMTLHAGTGAQLSEHILRDSSLQGSSGSRYEEQRFWIGRVVYRSPSRVGSQGTRQIRPNGHKPRLVELAFANREDSGGEIHIGQGEGQCLTDPQTSAIQKQNEHSAGMGLQFAARVLADGGGVEQPPEFVTRVDVGHESWRWFGDELGERGDVRVSPANRETIESAERFVFAMPEARDRSAASDVGVHTICLDVGHRHISYSSAERPQCTRFGVKTHAHRLLVRDILGDCL